MSTQTSIAEAVHGHGIELIGKTVYFEAKRVVKFGNDYPKIRGAGNKPYYDIIPGTVQELTPTGVVIAAAGGMYNRCMGDIILSEDLDFWMRKNPLKWVLRGEA